MDEATKLEKWVDETKLLLTTSSTGNRYDEQCSIPIVAEELRKWNKKAYEPKVVSIGPRYKGRRELQQMEEIKFRCMTSLLNRSELEETGVLKICMQVMLGYDAASRLNYEEDIKLDRYDLATTMVYDAFFLIELLISGSTEWNSKLESRCPGPGAEVGKMEEVLRDLMLLENQIPHFALIVCFYQLFPTLISGADHRLIEVLALSLLGYSQVSSSNSIPNHSQASGSNSMSDHSQGSSSNSMPDRNIYAPHFLQLAHTSVVMENNQQSHQHSSVVVVVNINKQVKLNRCATRLQAAGVRVRREEDSVIPISRSSKFDIKFNINDGLLEIPTLHIAETTEVKWRNFIALEHHKKKWKRSSGVGGEVFTFSALLFNDLICCTSDVQLLRNRGIIVNELGMSNHDLMDLFHSVANGVDRDLVDSSDYNNMIDALNTYSATNLVL